MSKTLDDLFAAASTDIAAHTHAPGAQAAIATIRRRTTGVVAASVTAVLLICVLSLTLLAGRPGTVEPAPAPTLSPSPYAGNGWPDTTRNAPGVYALDGDRCEHAACNVGFIHNGYGSGDVDIRIDVDPKMAAADPEDGASVVVAGHDGIYQRTDAQHEQWIVDIEGTTTIIELKAKPDTSRADLSEAHAIIDSMRIEPDNNSLGFSLVFTIKTNDWDSG